MTICCNVKLFFLIINVYFQLLAVLPAASKDLLPLPFHFLMTNDNSPILTYYPLEFETDLNGKKNDWEAVVVIPFINEVSNLDKYLPKLAYINFDVENMMMETIKIYGCFRLN